MGSRKKLSWITAALVFVLGLWVYALLGESEEKYVALFAGSALFISASIAASFIYHFVGQAEQEQEIRRAIVEAETRISNGIVRASKDKGLHGFIERLDYGKLFDSLKEGDELLWLDTFAHSYAAFLEKLQPALGRGVRMRILVIDSQCENARHRANEIVNLYFSPAHFTEGVEGFLSAIRENAGVRGYEGDANGPVEVRTYSDLPCVPMYIVCRAGQPVRGYTSFFLHKATDGYMHLEWRHTEGGVLADLKEYFDRKWRANSDRVEFVGSRREGTQDGSAETKVQDKGVA